MLGPRHHLRQSPRLLLPSLPSLADNHQAGLAGRNRLRGREGDRGRALRVILVLRGQAPGEER